MKPRIALIMFLVLAVTPAMAADAPKAETPEKPPTVTFAASDESVVTVAETISKQTGARFLIEKAAEVKITASVTDASLDDALAAVCKSGDLAWRRIYLRADSPLVKKPEALASTVRLMAGLQFPNLLIEQSSALDNLVHIANKPAVDAIPMNMRKDLGMVAVYLITNDKAARVAKEKAESRVAKYMELQKESMKLFMEMTPEEREQAAASGVQMVQQLDPRYMAEMTKSVLKMDPQALGQLTQMQMQNFFAMPPADRRALMRMQMQAMNYITPEQRKMLQEEAVAVMKEMGMPVPEQPGQ